MQQSACSCRVWRWKDANNDTFHFQTDNSSVLMMLEFEQLLNTFSLFIYFYFFAYKYSDSIDKVEQLGSCYMQINDLHREQSRDGTFLYGVIVIYCS